MEQDKQSDLLTRMEMVQAERRCKRATKKVRSEMRKNSLASEYLRNHNVLISYVRDKYGFRKGVVVARGAGIVGWSIVSKEDYVCKMLELAQLPYLSSYLADPVACVFGKDSEQTLSAAEALDMLVNDPGYRSWAENGGYISYPLFDRGTGLVHAINRMNALEAAINADSDISIAGIDLPYDPDLRNALDRMIVRSYRYFKSTTPADAK